MTDNADENRGLEDRTAAKAKFRLGVDLKVIAVRLVAAQLGGATPAQLRRLTDELVSGMEISVGHLVGEGVMRGVRLGHEHGGNTDGVPEIPHTWLIDYVGGIDRHVLDQLLKAVDLANALPMDSPEDVTAVIAATQRAMRTAEMDAAWAVHRAIALGVSEVALADGLNVVWVAERNACLHCLAYQGRVVAPGSTFPTGLTYGDKGLPGYGELIGPPLHPWCRCELETTDLEPGEIDEGMAREAARSVARGLTDFTTEVGKFRAVDRLLKGTTGLPVPRLPKSVLERAERNLADAEFRFRPGSAGAKVEIAARQVDRARARARKV